MKTNFILILIAIVTLSSCHRYYTASSFQEKVSNHKTIAILPPQIVITGNLPRSFSANQVAELEEKESLLFQEALYNYIFSRSHKGKRKMQVTMQPYSNTLSALHKANISMRDTWRMSDNDLSVMLGVDAVVRTTIQKERLMSHTAAAGIETGKEILKAITKSETGSSINARTNVIHGTCSIISNGETLWTNSYSCAIDYW